MRMAEWCRSHCLPVQATACLLTWTFGVTRGEPSSSTAWLAFSASASARTCASSAASSAFAALCSSVPSPQPLAARHPDPLAPGDNPMRDPPPGVHQAATRVQKQALDSRGSSERPAGVGVEMPIMRPPGVGLVRMPIKGLAGVGVVRVPI